VERLNGIFAIPVTPFGSDGLVDEPSLCKVVAFALECGANGLLTSVNASEWYTLSDQERARVVEIALTEVAGQVPVIVGVTAQNTPLACELAVQAEKAGAAAVNSMPPHITHPDAAGCYAHYRALSAAVDIPIVVQNYYPPIGTPMSTELLTKIVADFENIQYVKEETLPEPLRVSELLEAAGPKLWGVFGGQGGLHIVDEFRRGACGNMPAGHVVDVLAKIWNALSAKDEPAARRMHQQLLPLITLERTWGGAAVYKEVLFRRGVIAHTARRTATPDLDSSASVELDHALAAISDLLDR
jgi:4-hydroxy-tetrahydrodipicolinate synthase